MSIEWAAGLFEGEDSIVCYKLRNRKDSIRTQLTLSSTDKDVVEKFIEIVNCGKLNGPYDGKKEGYKERYDWYVQNQRDCLYVLIQLYPFLCSRRKQKADEMIALILERF